MPNLTGPARIPIFRVNGLMGLSKRPEVTWMNLSRSKYYRTTAEETDRIDAQIEYPCRITETICRGRTSKPARTASAAS